MSVIARAPLRISLAGGGTDLPEYADRYGGLVVSTSIDRYVYVILTEAADEVLQVTAADAGSVLSRRDHLFDSALFWGADYRLPLEILEHFGVHGGRRVFIASEVPPGTGLGSSSATAVALITALAADRRTALTPREVAELACEIEIERMAMPIGRQDQYAAAFGGLNRITFGRDVTELEPVPVSSAIQQALSERMLLFFTGQRRRSTEILSAQRQETSRPGSATLQALHEIKRLAERMLDTLLSGDLAAVGALLDQSWWQKRALAPGVSNDQIDLWYAEARAAGAAGGKITGAGGGGFLLLYAEPAARAQVIQRMSELGLVWVDTDFEREGARVVLAERAPALVG
jgi:D-glycero-alpha-D-manno-heptose-7-phosphate kinase